MERLARFLTGASFQRGLALGAMVGAAIAGSTIWSRIRAARNPDVSDVDASRVPAGDRDRINLDANGLP